MEYNWTCCTPLPSLAVWTPMCHPLCCSLLLAGNRCPCVKNGRTWFLSDYVEQSPLPYSFLTSSLNWEHEQIVYFCCICAITHSALLEQRACSNYSTTTGPCMRKLVRISGTQEKERKGEKEQSIDRSSVYTSFFRHMELGEAGLPPTGWWGIIQSERTDWWPWYASLGQHLSSFLMPLLEVRYPPLLLLPFVLKLRCVQNS